eukprot:TRINITY_DN16200_c0_g2_i2.p1 TRINITY_DN16200_c0_g2~~TRINITY_DN16200_c0_g2_i2.p1  ORF type:complete len:150 (+),score=33.72 TRINITY_DN16200_c0_g2_i2:124-573(+)
MSAQGGPGEREYMKLYSSETYFADAQQLGYPRDFMDVIIMLHVLEHVPDYRRALRELHRVLKANGTLIMEVPCGKDYATRDCRKLAPQARTRGCAQHDHIWDYNCMELFEEFAEEGFNCRAHVVAEDVANAIQTKAASNQRVCKKTDRR